MKGVSVIICCYNSSQRLPETLKHLALQQVPSNIAWEVVIVNNASNDATVEVANEEWRKYNLQQVGFTIVDQPIPGLNSAREKGASEAAFEYIIFCDDDNWLEKNYVATAFQIMEADTKIGAGGGQSSAVSDSEFPGWFDEFKHGYAIGEQASETRDTTSRLSVWGAGMVTRKSLYLSSFPENFPSLLTDRKGNQLSAGGDSEYVMRLIFSGYSLFYNENLIFKHFIPSERLTSGYRDKLFRGFEDSGVILIPYSRQAQIALLSNAEKPLFFFKRLVKYLVGKIKSVKDWDTVHEAMLIYHLTGIQLVKADEISKTVRRIYSRLKKR